MKYTIEGLSQAEAIRIGLDLKDLVLLRWIVDFYSTGKMETHVFGDKHYFWINYQKVVEELPLLGIKSKDVLARRMRHIEQCGILEFNCFEGAGCRTYYRFREDALSRMISDSANQGELFGKKGGSDRNKGGSYSKVGRVPTQKSEGFLPESRNHIDSSTNDSSTSDSKEEPKPSNGKDLKVLTPTQQFVEQFGYLYRELTGQPFDAVGKHFVIADGLIKKFGMDEVVKRTKILAVNCKEGRLWWCKEEGVAAFTIETLKSRWNNLVPQIKLSDEEIRQQKFSAELKKIQEHNERVKNTIDRSRAGRTVR
jgi:hypothetical protein